MMLIHVCCADCCLKMVEAISYSLHIPENEIHLYYYNPNIHPQTEYTMRQQALQKVAGERHLKLIIANWTPNDYFTKIPFARSATMKVRRIRCPICWSIRLSETFAYAKSHGYTCISSTMLTSHYMDKDIILQIGNQLSRSYAIDFYNPKVQQCDIKTSGFYKQNYCGCIYSLFERMEEKYGTDKQ